MDADRFDALSCALTRGHTRRSLARLLAALSLGGALSALGTTDVLAALRIGGAPCTTNSQCKTGRCVGKSGHKKCTCSTAVGCKQPADRCKHAVCGATDRCVIRPTCPPDTNPCTNDLCSDGVCSYPADPTKNGSACNDGAGTCRNGTCDPNPTCTDGSKNGTETGIDCGGTCPPCANDQGCVNQDDCESALCVSRVCKACTTNTDCGIDNHGNCECSTTVDGEKVCSSSTAAQVALDCGECGAKYCLPNNGAGFLCVDRCGGA